ncbi:SPOR domain-containing protein [Parasphingorhabdus sp.]|uniref:SPOR domain-containing protein n=1 Tax=Parasphingorhabdus sp. TaxID=2709688 RepID=UPI002F9209F0
MSKFPFTHRLLIASALFGLASPTLATVKDGVDAWGRGDYSTAVAEWRGPANEGDADAQFNMGQAYKLGRGVTMDLAMAEQYYKKAADQGHLQASDNYGLILFQDERRNEARPYLQASAERGEPRAQYILGTGYFNGDFVEKDWVKAYALITRASAAGLPQATSNMAQMDKYIPLEQRRSALALASQMEENEKRSRIAQIGGLRPIPSTGVIETAQLPASQIVTAAPAVSTATSTPVPAPKPVAKPSVAQAPTVPPSTTKKTPKPAPVQVAAAKSDPKPTPKTTPAKPAAADKWRAQLGAFSDQKRAKALWDSLGKRVSALNGLQPYIETTGSITRLQTGPFATKAQASKICTTVKAAGNDCIVKSR